MTDVGRRVAPVLALVLALSFVAAPLVAITPGDAATPTGPGPLQTNGTATNGTAGDVSIATQARITAIAFDRPYLRVERRNEDTWNTTGPYAVFAVSEPVDAVRITQPTASARVKNDHTVRVAYDPQAAPSADDESLYTVEVFFDDGSKRTLDLYATQTDQIVASAALQESQGFIETMKEDAEEHGYPATIEGIQQYHEWEKEQADLFNNIFAPQFEKLFAWLVVTIQTPFAIMLLAGLATLAAWLILRSHGEMLRTNQNSVNLVEQSRRKMRLAYRENQDAADEERLEDLDAIGPAAIYWNDGLNINSVRQLAYEFAYGRPQTDDHGNIIRYSEAEAAEKGIEPMADEDGTTLRDDDGEPIYPPKMVHRGVEDLRGETRPRDTWLEPMLRPDMLGDYQTVLAHAKRALARMTTHYGKSQYRPARRKVASLLESLTEGDTPNYTAPTSSTSGPGGRGRSSGGTGTGHAQGAVGGDD